MANQKFTSIKNEYSIIFDRNSEIEPVTDDMDIKETAFCFSSINEIKELE